MKTDLVRAFHIQSIDTIGICVVVEKPQSEEVVEDVVPSILMPRVEACAP